MAKSNSQPQKTIRKPTSKAKPKKGKDWISKAVEKPGAFAAKAKKAGKTTKAYATEKKDAPGKLGKQARLALTLMKLSVAKKKKKKK